MNKVACWALIALLMASCSQQPQNITSPTSVAFVDSPAPTNTVFSKPLITPTISSTPYPVPTKTLTLTLDPISLTQEAAVSSCAATERTWYTKHLSSDYFTKGQWGAVICSDNGIYTRVTNTSLDLTWNVPSYDDGNVNTPEPSWYWAPYLWSGNGKYLYLRSVCLCFIDSPWLLYSSGFGLSRLDLETGEFDIWLKPSDIGYSFEFSNDGNLLAFSLPDYSDVIKIRDLKSNNEQNLNFKEKYIILEFRWTSDNSQLVIFTEEHEDNPSESGFSVFVYSIEKGALRKLLDKNTLNSSFPTENSIEPRIYISDLTDDILTLSHVFDENTFKLNIQTGELSYINK